MKNRVEPQHFFYQEDVLAMTVGAASTRLMHANHPVAQLSAAGDVDPKLYLADDSRTILGAADSQVALAYTPFGFMDPSSEVLRLAYKGEKLDRLLQGYALGRGKRFYSTVHSIFHSPNPTSPFGKGGLNCYAYCGGDPINFTDPSGLARFPFKNLQRLPCTSIPMRQINSMYLPGKSQSRNRGSVPDGSVTLPAQGRKLSRSQSLPSIPTTDFSHHTGPALSESSPRTVASPRSPTPLVDYDLLQLGIVVTSGILGIVIGIIINDIRKDD